MISSNFSNISRKYFSSIASVFPLFNLKCFFERIWRSEGEKMDLVMGIKSSGVKGERFSDHTGAITDLYLDVQNIYIFFFVIN